jgi:ribonuclease HIII
VTTYTARLSEEEGRRLEAIVRNGTFQLRTVPHAHVCAVKPDVSVTWYQSGKLVVQGKGTQEFVEFTLEPQVLLSARQGYEDDLDPTRLDPRLGVDESGKGDFFGPMCIAGVYINKDVLAAWKGVGIRDSKNITSDNQVARLAKVIRETKGCVWNVVAIGNEAYNRMHAANGSVNRILAWGHARVIENLLGQGPRLNPPPVRAISDQFAASKDLLQKALMKAGRSLELVQRHKAEEDVAVAAASILARDEYVTRLRLLGEQHGLELPKGASERVEQVGREFVARHGADALPKVAKMHFRTSYRVLGLPEPPREEWRPPQREDNAS